ncbi:MAG: bifunctional 2-C-methyl-D-erythritol 4-phosphate cytidylyltransferase/2-C-methyl-D-erythritol 2,4-cyclodiphosphate synthase [Hyphomicrobiales bacterium]|nr:bifunctional 2-C-methyl-D-erythritol 4-phosphate cytidylyltransferase/2-C-methyl-D-erythritol 2,4-cyclodiphosphate synthase [Hyphomicrobiales bacterium]
MKQTQTANAYAVVLVAGGRGLRAGGGLPKQYRTLSGRPVLTRTIENFLRALPGAPIVCAIHPDDRELYEMATAQIHLPAAALLEPAYGGASRQASVLAGLNALHEVGLNKKYVLIHDSVRCISSKTLLKNLASEGARTGAAIPGYAIPDALKKTGAGDRVTGDVARDGICAVQTPQVFDLDLIYSAHLRAAQAGRDDFPDDAAVAQWAGHPVTIVPGDPANIKLTTQADFALAERLLMTTLADIRTGSGFDVHAFAEGNGVWLCGVNIPHTHALSGHSDADVALHALTDAILGAIADGDIGSHFPPSDPQWKGASSDRFLKHAVSLVAARGGDISHLDVTIICEAPKVGPHRDRMRASISAITGIPDSRISVKATTTEKLGFTGRREGIAAQAVATVRLPYEEPLA